MLAILGLITAFFINPVFAPIVMFITALIGIINVIINEIYDDK